MDTVVYFLPEWIVFMIDLDVWLFMILHSSLTQEGTIKVTDKSLPHLRNPEILIGENDLTSLSYLNEPEGSVCVYVNIHP